MQHLIESDSKVQGTEGSLRKFQGGNGEAYMVKGDNRLICWFFRSDGAMIEFHTPYPDTNW